MDCITGKTLERAFDSRRKNHIEAVAAPYFVVSSAQAANKNVAIEQAKGFLEDHRSVCVSYTTGSLTNP